MLCRRQTERHCDCGVEVFSELSRCEPQSLPESAGGSGCSKPERYPGQSRASTAGKNGAKDQGGDRSAGFHRPRWAAALRWPSALPVRRRPEYAAIPAGRLPRSVAKEIRATDGTSDSTASNAGGDGEPSGARAYAARSPQIAGRTNIPEGGTESVGAVVFFARVSSVILSNG